MGNRKNLTDEKNRPGNLDMMREFQGTEPLRQSAASVRRRPIPEGFTLLEVVIVVTVLALFVGMALPRLPDVGGARIHKAARKVAGALMLARSRAVTLRRYYRLDLSLDENRIELSYFGPEGTFIPDDGTDPVVLDHVRLADVVTAGKGKSVEGKGEIHISPRGQVEPSIVHLSDDRGRVLTIMPTFLGGRVAIEEGYLGLAVKQ